MVRHRACIIYRVFSTMSSAIKSLKARLASGTLYTNCLYPYTPAECPETLQKYVMHVDTAAYLVQALPPINTGFTIGTPKEAQSVHCRRRRHLPFC